MLLILSNSSGSSSEPLVLSISQTFLLRRSSTFDNPPIFSISISSSFSRFLTYARSTGRGSGFHQSSSSLSRFQPLQDEVRRLSHKGWDSHQDVDHWKDQGDWRSCFDERWSEGWKGSGESTISKSLMDEHS